MYRRKPKRKGKGPRTWGEVYRELAAIGARADELFARWSTRMEEALARAGCCITIAEILREFRARAWARAVREQEQGQNPRRSKQLTLF
ncbi:hypothetical protein HYW17_02690 [Candidatus Uhrbacteria bacterium]|nr:hypothetical protein [Candidatus Uhrbacteria bacterium]